MDSLKGAPSWLLVVVWGTIACDIIMMYVVFRLIGDAT